MIAAVIVAGSVLLALITAFSVLIYKLGKAKDASAADRVASVTYIANAETARATGKVKDDEIKRIKAELATTKAALAVERARAVHGLADDELRDALNGGLSNADGDDREADPGGDAGAGAAAVPGSGPAAAPEVRE